MAEHPTVVQAWSAVMEDVRAIRKDERNQSQGFSFRGIDTTVNAVGPVLRKHGVVVTPYPEDITTTSYQTNRGTTMFSAIVKMRYTVRGPAGDSFDGGAFGEAADAGDKAVSKAQSVAYRVFLLQGLTIPTDEPDPDTETHQRAATPAPPVLSAPQKALQVRGELLTAAQRAEVRSVWAAQGLPGKAADMTDDEAHIALDLLNDQFGVT